ncbi:MAG TPA: imidazolonepropionase, partial [Anaerolineaceae bacterium]
MLIHSASQLLTLSGGPQRGAALGDLGLIEDGAVVVDEGVIVAIGPTEELRAAYPREPKLDVSGRAVLPGFVDPHTHLIWAGDRVAEFEQRLQGKSYQEIQASGGGILSTVRATREASPEELLEQARSRARTMFEHGTTTAEAKTGYGLETARELLLLETLLALDAEGPLDIIPTF